MTDFVGSTSDARVGNNTVRHQYRVLSDEEKAQMLAVKDKGAEFLALLDGLHAPPEPIKPAAPGDDLLCGLSSATYDRELIIAKERVEEAVMWAVKHITA